MIGFLFFSVFLEIIKSNELFLYDKNPYNTPGPFETHSIHIEKSEYQTFVIYPKKPGNYSVMYFIGGFAGVIPSELYSDILSTISSYGVVVVGFDIIDPFKKEQHFFKEVEFLKSNLQKIISKHTKDVFPKINDYAGIFCHSGGCSMATKLIIENQEFAKLAFYIDPVGYIFPKMKVSIPSLITGGGVSGNCAMKNISYHRFYDDWMCPKIMYNQTGYAHCAPINEILVKPCSLFCGGGRKNVKEFHKWISGIIVSFISVVLKNGKNCSGMKEYVLNCKTFPIKVDEFKVDFSCISPGKSCFL